MLKDNNKLQKLDKELTGEEASKLIIEVEETIDAIKNGEMEGEYFEF